MYKYIVIKEFLLDGPAEASHLFVFAHGAGKGMATPFMSAIAEGLAGAGIRVLRFHFPYMEEAVRSGRRRPPDRSEVLRECYAEVIAHCVDRERCPRSRLVIGGKSMGGRIASMVADDQGVAGVVSLGFPFYTPGKPDRVRARHLAALKTPMLICQGERDPFGSRPQVSRFRLPSGIRIHWLPDGDHQFKCRRRSGRTEAQNFAEAVDAAAGFIRAL